MVIVKEVTARRSESKACLGKFVRRPGRDDPCTDRHRKPLKLSSSTERFVIRQSQLKSPEGQEGTRRDSIVVKVLSAAVRIL